jgi:hypothetical protein
MTSEEKSLALLTSQRFGFKREMWLKVKDQIYSRAFSKIKPSE